MLSYGLLTNPSNEILSEISKIYDLNFDYAELGIEGPEGNPKIINKKKDEIAKLLQKFKQKPIGHTAYWIDLCSDYDYVRHAWILEAMREIRTVKNGRHRSNKFSCLSNRYVLRRKEKDPFG